MKLQDLELKHKHWITDAIRADKEIYLIQYGEEYVDLVSDSIQECEDYVNDNDPRTYKIIDYKTGEIMLEIP